MDLVRLAFLAFLASCSLFIFVFGVVVGHYKIFPFPWMEAAKDSVELVFQEKEIILGIRPTRFLFKARHNGAGVTRNEPDRAAPGLTLLAGFFEDSNELRLLRSDGGLVRRWPVRFNEVFTDQSHIQPPEQRAKSDWNVGLHGALALPDGSVVLNLDNHGAVKLDRCGKIEWRVSLMTHHSVEPAEDGGYWFSVLDRVEDKSQFLPIKTPYIEDKILKVSRDGEVLFKISVPALFEKNDLRAVLLVNNSVDQYDLVHLNDIEELTSDVADRFPLFAAGDLIISMRNLNLVMVVDPKTEVVKWHRTGPWIRQHDPDFQPDGTITVFNNNTDDTEGGRLFGGGNIIRINPMTGIAGTLFPANGDARFYTAYRGKHQVLPNGNVLVVESNAGRVFESDPEGRVVWEYINRYDEESIAYISDALRYPEGYFTLDSWECP